MEFSRQEYWSRLPYPPPADLPDPGIKPASPVSPALQADPLPTEPPGKPNLTNGGDKNPRPYFRRLEQGLNLLSTVETDKLKPPIFQITLAFFTVAFTSNLWGKCFQLTFCTTVNHILFPRMQNRKIPKLFNSTECLSKQPD